MSLVYWRIISIGGFSKASLKSVAVNHSKVSRRHTASSCRIVGRTPELLRLSLQGLSPSFERKKDCRDYESGGVVVNSMERLASSCNVSSSILSFCVEERRDATVGSSFLCGSLICILF